MTPIVPASPATPRPSSEAANSTPAPVPDLEIRVYGHSNLFYWWPVWALGFLFAFLTYLDGHVMAVVPAGTQIESGQVVAGFDGVPRDVLVAPAGQAVPPPPGAYPGEPVPRLRVANNNNYGVVFVGSILLVIMVTNFLFRGLASVIAIAAIAIVGLIVALFGWWDPVLAWLGGLDVRMNAGGYLTIAIPLFAMWLFSTFIYDHYTYLIVSRGQVRIRREIGGGELAVDAGGLMLTKERDDLFRHWLLGLGTGDLHVKTGGPSNLDFELYNVLFIGTKLAKIQDMLREKEVSEQAPGQ
ncbi:MAG: hypothetical protein K8U57_07685 [Planctomycetes bacterium]|nr:hypothetical protein [Planctomycetota bacterium]